MTNKILDCLPPADKALLQDQLKHVSLRRMVCLEKPKSIIKQVYFIESGLASVIAVGPGGNRTEIGIIGPEGLTGSAVILGAQRSRTETVVQIEGHGFKLNAADLLDAMRKSQTLASALKMFVHDFTTQVGQTALAYSRATIVERLARWLLMAQDRLDTDEVALTHDMLSLMLGVRRAGVSQALATLAGQGVIAKSAGKITILDRKLLVEAANGFY